MIKRCFEDPKMLIGSEVEFARAVQKLTRAYSHSCSYLNSHRAVFGGEGGVELAGQFAAALRYEGHKGTWGRSLRLLSGHLGESLIRYAESQELRKVDWDSGPSPKRLMKIPDCFDSTRFPVRSDIEFAVAVTRLHEAFWARLRYLEAHRKMLDDKVCYINLAESCGYSLLYLGSDQHFDGGWNTRKDLEQSLSTLSFHLKASLENYGLLQEAKESPRPEALLA